MASAFDHGQALVMMMVTQVSNCLNEYWQRLKLSQFRTRLPEFCHELKTVWRRFFEDQWRCIGHAFSQILHGKCSAAWSNLRSINWENWRFFTQPNRIISFGSSEFRRLTPSSSMKFGIRILLNSRAISGFILSFSIIMAVLKKEITFMASPQMELCNRSIKYGESPFSRFIHYFCIWLSFISLNLDREHYTTSVWKDLNCHIFH